MKKTGVHVVPFKPLKVHSRSFRGYFKINEPKNVI